MVDSKRPIFKRFPEAGSIPMEPFSHLPTPVMHLPDIPNTGGQLWVKLDGMTHPVYGGNKVRKLEFLLADARAHGCDTVITVGGLGTNHGLATAIFAQQMGLKCHLVLFRQPITRHVLASLKLYHHFGATLHMARSYPEVAFRVLGTWAASKFKLTGDNVAVIQPGGSSPLGTLGFVNAALELEEQVREGLLPEPAVIFVALGSCGTLAGLAAGLRCTGLKSRLVGVRVTPKIVTHASAVATLATEALDLLRLAGAHPPKERIRKDDIEVIDGYMGDAYGEVTVASKAAVKTAAAHGLIMETTYTGKAFAACLDWTRDNPESGPVLFWNTFNSKDVYSQAEPLDCKQLPSSFHRFFEHPLED
jgi:1-aminocyclopropane-1-carboxylate deaminase/D-cysteine desulfhydrase-like pyridoxal-dependent ACC family enzyme